MAQSRHSYVNRRVRDAAYMVEEKVLLKVSPMKGVIRFAKKGKLSPRYIGPFEVLRRIGEVAHKLALQPSLSSVPPIFHVSMIRKYVGNLSYVLDFSTVQLDGDLTYDLEPMAILDRQFTGAAFRWWEAYERRKLVGAAPHTWQEFSVLFLEKFMLQCCMEELCR
ncbi:uncharacterized protein [Nicotiana sylvestris]|uniref:uncharacterized protein n=1 Tax=Nicotiana sylvestris TaxID=4096 RepID=UPI00388C9F79